MIGSKGEVDDANYFRMNRQAGCNDYFRKIFGALQEVIHNIVSLVCYF